MILDLGMLVSMNVFISQFFLHFHLLLCLPSLKSEVKHSFIKVNVKKKKKSQCFPMACLLLEIRHLSDLSTL